MKRAARRDANEAAIVSALQQIGATVFRMNAAGLPDLLVHYRAQWIPLEVKTAKGRLTPAQEGTRLIAWFPVVRSIGEALALFGVRV